MSKFNILGLQSSGGGTSNDFHCCRDCFWKDGIVIKKCDDCLNKNQTWKLWLDDQYDEPDMIFRHPPLGFISCRSSGEAIVLTLEKGLPEYISFDHDLGDNDTSINYINFLIENYFDEVVPDYTVHSANPIGKTNIISKMESWKKAQGIK